MCCYGDVPLGCILLVLTNNEFGATVGILTGRLLDFSIIYPLVVEKIGALIPQLPSVGYFQRHFLVCSDGRGCLAPVGCWVIWPIGLAWKL